MMLKGSKTCGQVTSVFLIVGLIITALSVAEESAPEFRQQNGLLAYAPPAWFTEGYFIAREKNPAFVFGPVQDFVRALGGKTTWLIEDLELERLKRTSAEGTSPEYSLYLEVVKPEHTEYWVFVALPYESAREWFDARRAYHGGKAENYYGETQGMLERALSQGLKIKSELRFLIENEDVSLEPPENLIMNRYQFKPVFDLNSGRRLDSTANTE
jgi:hypothetical protein